MRKSLPILLLFFAFYSEALFALDIEKLFMPGDVISGHQKLETDCKNCHERGRKTTQLKLCLDCHEKVNKDVQDKTGFHGKNGKANSTDCRVCHTDHKGRDANIVWLDSDRFNHAHTDYELIGKHRQAECTACHKKEVKFRDTLSECIDCHKEDDVHKNKLGEKCASCHTPKAWTSEQFDHDKTDFKLKYGHKKVACDLCHVENSYKDTPKTCVSCHAIKDVHKNRFGRECQDCHNEKKWSESTFDHTRDTQYVLKGIHKSVTCHACHTKPVQKKKPGKVRKTFRTCYSCHRLDDVHKGRNGEKCQDCHNEKKWS